MKNLVNTLRHRRDITLLSIALLFLIIAMFKPTVPVKRDIYSYFMVVDITQSMNVKDATLNGTLVSRMEYQQFLLHRMIGEMPCGTQVSIGLFAGVSVAALYTPIEVCENFAGSGKLRISLARVTMLSRKRLLPDQPVRQSR